MRNIVLMLTAALCAGSVAARTLPPANRPTVAKAETVGTEIEVMGDRKPSRITHPGASYISIFFEEVRLGKDDRLTVRAKQAGGRTWTYTAADVPKSRSFWSIAILGEADTDGQPLSTTVFIDLENKSGNASYTVNRYAAGLSKDQIVIENQPTTGFLEICGLDDTKEAKCYAAQTTIYARSRAVARLLINGSAACTGWLVGAEGHFLTNEHCVRNAEDALNVQVEFMAEGTACATNCDQWFACPGTIAATNAKLLKVNFDKDYALLKLNASLAKKYGYLKLRRSGPAKGERVYIPQHPRGSGKRLAIHSSQLVDKKGPMPGFTHVNSLTEPACGGNLKGEVGYEADTDPGASGSPVIGYRDHAVVALHHCGGCPNRGVPVTAIIADIGKLLPPSAFVK